MLAWPRDAEAMALRPPPPLPAKAPPPRHHPPPPGRAAAGTLCRFLTAAGTVTGTLLATATARTIAAPF
jgi:hypothetical protein